MANVIDWTVDKLLSSVRTMNSDAIREQGRIRAMRAKYMDTLRKLPTIANAPSRERLRAQLQDWVHRQVGLENTFNEFLARFAAVKAGAKKLLQAVHIEPPAYLGAIPIIVPAALITIAIVAGAAIAKVVAQAIIQSKSLDGLNALVQVAAEQHWTEQQTIDGINAYHQAATPPPGAGPGGGDPLGLSEILKQAGPVLLGIAAIILLPPIISASKGSRS